MASLPGAYPGAPGVLPPKTRGAWAARSTRPGADVMVVAHARFGRFGSARLAWEALPLSGRPFLVSTWTYAAGEVPDDPAWFDTWLDARWRGSTAGSPSTAWVPATAPPATGTGPR